MPPKIPLTFNTAGEFHAFVTAYAQSGFVAPDVWGVRITYRNNSWQVTHQTCLVPNYKCNSGSAAVLAYLVGYRTGTSDHPLSLNEIEEALRMLSVHKGDGRTHSNIEWLEKCHDALTTAQANPLRGMLPRCSASVSFIDLKDWPGPTSHLQALLVLDCIGAGTPYERFPWPSSPIPS